MKNEFGGKTNLPEWPNKIGYRGKVTMPPDGKVFYLKVEDEIRRQQSTDPNKVLYLQKIRYEQSNQLEFRFGYYIIGKKPRMKGKWVWGQFAPLMPAEDFQAIIQEARARGWL